MTALRVEAPAKLNLWLSVTGRRPDGYHLLASEMVLLELADRLLLMPGGSGLRVEAPPDGGIPASPQRNLAWQGLMAGTGGTVPMALLALEKRIPAAAGLGGGSSDAAAAWRLGRRWLGADEVADETQLASLASIGADVPFFAAGVAAALVEGVGERITPRDLPPGGHEVLLVHPPFPLSTGAVFGELRRDEWSGGSSTDDRNDLLAPALRLRPELADVLAAVADAGARPQLSGSGPTVFVRGDDPERVTAVAERLSLAGLAVTVTRLRREPARIEAVDDEVEEG